MTHLDPIGSNHNPILVDLLFKEAKTPSVFIFEKRWIYHPDYKDVVDRGWRNSHGFNDNPLKVFCRKLDSCRSTLAKWSKSAYLNSKKNG